MNWPSLDAIVPIGALNFSVLSLTLRILGFVAALAVFFWPMKPDALLPRVLARLAALYVAGAVTAFFIEGPTYGTMEPVSTRPLMVILGALAMDGALFWMWQFQSVVNAP